MVEILYCDQHIVVCVKEAGLLSQDAEKNSLPGMLREQLQVPYVGVIHRLDKEVGGVMVYALSQRAAAGLSQAVQNHHFEKTYLAVMTGVPEAQEGILEDLLYHDKTRNKTYIVKRMRKGVKEAKLSYSTLKASATHSMVWVKLHTGRTHQIRVQFASRKLPLVGDAKYGGKQQGMPLMLWSHKLRFQHPVSQELLVFESEPHWKAVADEWFT